MSTMRLNTSPFGAWIAAKVGPKWVIASRQTERIAHQYPGATVITPKRYRALEAEYIEMNGDPYDDARAAMWRCLKAIHAHIVHGDSCQEVIAELVRTGLEAERKAVRKRLKQ